MSHTHFKMHMIVPVKLIGAIIELLNSEGVLVSVEPHDDSIEAPKTRKTRKTKRAGRVGGFTGKDLALQALSKGPMTFRQLANIFEAQGRAAISASPAVSVLQKNGIITRDPDTAKYSIVPGKAPVKS